MSGPDMDQTRHEGPAQVPEVMLDVAVQDRTLISGDRAVSLAL